MLSYFKILQGFCNCSKYNVESNFELGLNLRKMGQQIVIISLVYFSHHLNSNVTLRVIKKMNAKKVILNYDVWKKACCMQS